MRCSDETDLNSGLVESWAELASETKDDIFDLPPNTVQYQTIIKSSYDQSYHWRLTGKFTTTTVLTTKNVNEPLQEEH